MRSFGSWITGSDHLHRTVGDENLNNAVFWVVAFFISGCVPCAVFFVLVDRMTRKHAVYVQKSVLLYKMTRCTRECSVIVLALLNLEKVLDLFVYLCLAI